MTNDLLEYWREKREYFVDAHKILHEDENRIILLCFQDIEENDKVWIDSWLEECRRNIRGKHTIYQFTEKQILED